VQAFMLGGPQPTNREHSIALAQRTKHYGGLDPGHDHEVVLQQPVGCVCSRKG
jgi:hypothetical protein